jgi:hypothetical protein
MRFKGGKKKSDKDKKQKEKENIEAEFEGKEMENIVNELNEHLEVRKK